MSRVVRSRITPGDGDPRHGTRNGYDHLGCRGECCSVASAADRARLGRDARTVAAGNGGTRRLPVGFIPGLSDDGSKIDAFCWCQRKILPVLRTHLLAGETASCGRPRCAPADRRVS